MGAGLGGVPRASGRRYRPAPPPRRRAAALAVRSAEMLTRAR
jgi:hypothetical protein